MNPPAATAGIDALLARGDHRAAFERIAAGLRTAPDDAGLWRALGRLYLRLDQHTDATAAYDRARQLDPHHVEPWQALAALREHAGDVVGAATLYRDALARGIDAPELRLGLAVALAGLGRRDEAGAQLDALLARHPGHATGWRVLGELHAAAGRPADAVAAFENSLARDDRPADVHYNLGLARDALGDRAGASTAMAAALARDPGCWPALAQWVFLKRQRGDWDGLDALSARLREAVRAGRPGLTPFSFLSEPATPEEQLACARGWARLKQAEATRLAPRLPAWRPAAKPQDAPIRVGFVSSGFHNHPTALLVVELIERLRDSGLVTLGFATHPGDGGALRQRLAAAFHAFEDISGLDHAGMAARLRAAELDVVFDLRGYGGGAVSEVFALRVAPVQVNWLAYPGTSGADFIDYLLTDAFAVPPAERAHCSEAVVRMPHAFQPSDSTRELAVPPARGDCGLPETGTVLASFNNGYKFTPEVFAVWTRILGALPDAVLWLLGDGNSELAANLRTAAQRAGIDPARLVFQPKLPHPQYLARYRHADLFLDTWPYNAHTTASDALWAGCPVLTLPGRTLASRVAGSLLHTLGLPELIATSVDDYVARAVALGRDAQARDALRAKLQAARSAAPLFDMARFAHDFTRAVRWMAARQRAGLPPTDHDMSAEETSA